MGIKFGKPGKRSDGPFKKVLKLIRKVLTVLFGFLTGFLFLFGFGEMIVYILDGGKNYSDWIRGPLIIFGVSFFFFLLWVVVNYDRIGILKGLRGSLSRSKPPEDYDIPELD